MSDERDRKMMNDEGITDVLRGNYESDEIAELKKVNLDLAEAVNKVHSQSGFTEEYCGHCNETQECHNDIDEYITHKPDCIVLKAEQIIKESK